MPVFTPPPPASSPVRHSSRPTHWYSCGISWMYQMCFYFRAFGRLYSLYSEHSSWICTYLTSHHLRSLLKSLLIRPTMTILYKIISPLLLQTPTTLPLFIFLHRRHFSSSDILHINLLLKYRLIDHLSTLERKLQEARGWICLFCWLPYLQSLELYMHIVDTQIFVEWNNTYLASPGICVLRYRHHIS